MKTLVSDYAWYFPVLCIFGALLLTGIAYFRNKKLKEFKPYKVYILSFLRFSSLFLSMLLLMNIFLKTDTQRIEKPILAFAIDNSESMVFRQNNSLKNDSLKSFLSEVFSLEDKLQEKYNVKYFSFGEKFSPVKNIESFDFKEKRTDFSQMFESLKSVLYNNNSGAMVVFSDGIFNKGQDPVYSAQNVGKKIYTVVLGDTSRYKDLSVSKVLYNESAFLGNEFPIEISVSAKMLKGKNSVCQVEHRGKTVYQENFSIKSDNFSFTIPLTLKANDKGFQKYSISLKPLEGEITEVNNSKDIIIEVVDDKYKILLLYAYPHPDVAAFKNALDKNLSYSTEISSVEEFSNKNILAFDLVVLFGLPSKKINTDKIFSDITTKHIPTFFVLNQDVDLQKFSKVNNCLEIISSGKTSLDEASFSENTNFSLFSFENGVQQILHSCPPLNCPFGDYKLFATTQVFGFQVIKGITTNKPLICVSEKEKARSAVISGDGIWRWRMDCYRRYLSHEKFDLFLQRISQYLLKKADKEMFSVLVKKIFDENEPVYFNAKVFDNSFNPIDDSDVSMEISSENGEKKSFKFEKNSSGYYLRVDNLLSGNYTFTAKTSKPKTMTKSGAFSIRQIKMESENLQADMSVMTKIARKTMGECFMANELSNLTANLLEDSSIKPSVYIEKSSVSIMDFKLLFFIIVLLFSLEWFLRKYWGTL